MVTFSVSFLGVPLLGVRLWRRPWWVRWAFLGVLLYNIGLLLWVQTRGTGELAGLLGRALCRPGRRTGVSPGRRW